MKKYTQNITLALLLIFVFSFESIIAQNIDSTQVEEVNDTTQVVEKKAKVKKEKLSDTTKLILNYIKSGNQLFDADMKRYDKAIIAYQKAEELGDSSEVLYYRIAYSYFQLKEYQSSAEYLKLVIDRDSITEFKAYYYLGRIYHLNYEFDSAITFFEDYRKSLSPDELNTMSKKIKKCIKECEIAKEMVANPVAGFLDILDTNINTPYLEYAPIVSTNDSLLFFTSRRPGNIGSGRDHNGDYFEDIYFSVKDSNGNWSMAKNLGKPVNSSAHDAAAGLSADASMLVVYRSNGNGDLYISKREGDNWLKPKKLNKFINTPAHEASASFSYDNMNLYFSSDREGGYGGHDIYKSSLDEKAKWGLPENLRSKINSAYDEMTFVAMPDGKTFYFTSNGHNSMGGLDIFKITYIDSVWSDPINLGYPINTPDNDVLYSLTADGARAYVASSKTDSSLHDIYMLTFMGDSKSVSDNMDGELLAFRKYGAALPEMDSPVNIQKLNLTVLKGIISDEFTDEPIFAQIELTDNSTNTVVATFNSNEQTGNYLVSLPSGKDYGIAVKAENCLFYSDNIVIDKTKGYKEIVKNIKLKRIEVGSKVVLKNVFFATGKAVLTESSETELQNLLKLLNDIPSLKLEISGHTDDVGKASSNKTLSEKRANAVVDYLLKNGISKDRLVAKGYGEEQPIANNKTKDGRQQNRRTEFKVIAR